MDTKAKLLCAAEQLFDQRGFTRTGMDLLAQAADMSSRTLYKHAGSKTALIAAVLNERECRFMRRLDVQRVDALFDALAQWMREEGSRGCLFLRAHGETGGEAVEISDILSAHKARLTERIGQIVKRETQGKGGEELVTQILILVEGATAVAAYQGVDAVESARRAATTLIHRARR